MTKSKEVTESIYEMLKTDFQFKNTNYGVLVTIETADGKEDVSINGDKFRSILANRYRKEYAKIVSSSKIKDCILSYRGEIIETYVKVKNSNRCDRGENDSILIDSGDLDDTYFTISKHGLKVKHNSSKHFYKHSRKGEIPYPDMRNGNINKIFKYCRIPNDMKNIFVAYLASLFIGDIEHPCLVLNGEQGTGKTTMSTFIKALIDPVANNRPSLFPKNDADLALMFQDNYLLAFDNLNKLSAKLSDKLCTIVTGVMESRRKLYTDNEMVHFDLCQPIILNGIHDIVKREDMLSRSIIITLTKPTNIDRIADEKTMLIDEFMNERPIILGGIFQILEEALNNYKPNSIPKYGKDVRMSSFYDYGYYICEAWEKGKGNEFCNDYIRLLQSQLENFQKNSYEEDLICTISCFVNDKGSIWEGTMSELLKELNDVINFVYENPIADGVKMPSTPNLLSREINKLRDKLEIKEGIIVEEYKDSHGCRKIELFKK